MSNYVEEHKESGLKVGDKVKVICKIDKWSSIIWSDRYMDDAIGGIYKIIQNDDELGFILSYNKRFWFPYSALKKVNKSLITVHQDTIGHYIHPAELEKVLKQKDMPNKIRKKLSDLYNRYGENRIIYIDIEKMKKMNKEWKKRSKNN